MPKDPKAIREKIKALQDELKDAQKKKEKAAKATVARAADRAGLHKIDISAKELESELKDLAQRLKNRAPKQDNSNVQNSQDQATQNATQYE